VVEDDAAVDSVSVAPVRVPRGCVEDFFLVVEHYGCSPDEVEEMKGCARGDLEAAQTCFAALATEIRAGLRAPQSRHADRLATCT
jgi:hypothetical protein